MLFASSLAYPISAVMLGHSQYGPLNEFIRGLTATDADFILENPPPASLVYDEHARLVVELPLR